MPALELRRRVLGERPQREAEVFMDVERAGDVLVVIDAVLRLVDLALEHAMVDQELAPLVIAVAGKQRIVEIEQGQAHARPEFNCDAESEAPSEAALHADAEVLQP